MRTYWVEGENVRLLLCRGVKLQSAAANLQCSHRPLWEHKLAIFGTAFYFWNFHFKLGIFWFCDTFLFVCLIPALFFFVNLPDAKIWLLSSCWASALVWINVERVLEYHMQILWKPFLMTYFKIEQWGLMTREIRTLKREASLSLSDKFQAWKIWRWLGREKRKPLFSENDLFPHSFPDFFYE